ncbi:MAG TPA: DUF1801 domain-containing protein [Candidatus Saccharimonadales bacterium]|nr:DUF1801 domain-containing protein [Candidatus Saccharimonadales bacterium]
MGELKTKATNESVEDFIHTVADPTKRQDSLELLRMYSRITGLPPKMWGTSIVGFGQYHYKSERSTQEGDWPLVGFSPRKQNLTLYFMLGFDGLKDLLSSLGKHKTSVGCLYINKLSDVDTAVLERIIAAGYTAMKQKYSDHPR